MPARRGRSASPKTHQTLVINRLRSRIAVQVDGGIRTGRDVVIGALLGADEFGFATAPLIAAGCIMMRKCHLNTCPVGVATQDPVLRKRFKGQPEHVINYFFFVAEEVREIMAQLGYRTFNEMVGQMQMLDRRKLVEHWKAKGLDFSKLFTKPKADDKTPIFHCEKQDHHLEAVLDRKLIADAQAALDRGAPVRLQTTINSTNRSRRRDAVRRGRQALRPHRPARRHHPCAPDRHRRPALGAWLAHGVTFELEGEANDYVGKGLSGGRIIIRPPADSSIVPEESIIVGNTVMYGAIAGECYFRGVAGERFAVRNSGATVVVEGTGDHCCEYMTRRRRRRARPHRAQLRRRHVGRHRLCDRRGRQPSRAAATWRWSRSSRCPRKKRSPRRNTASNWRPAGWSTSCRDLSSMRRRAPAQTDFDHARYTNSQPGASHSGRLEALSPTVQESDAGRIRPCAR